MRKCADFIVLYVLDGVLISTIGILGVLGVKMSPTIWSLSVVVITMLFTLSAAKLFTSGLKDRWNAGGSSTDFRRSESLNETP